MLVDSKTIAVLPLAVDILTLVFFAAGGRFQDFGDKSVFDLELLLELSDLEVELADLLAVQAALNCREQGHVTCVIQGDLA